MDSFDFGPRIRISGPAQITVIIVDVDRRPALDAVKTASEAIAMAIFVGGILSWVLAACIAAGG